MFDPKTVMTEHGMEELRAHHFNLEKALFFFINNADDLHIGAKDSKLLDTLYAMNTIVEDRVLVNGNGEERD